MLERKAFLSEARYLSSVMRIVWDNYDFSETSNVYAHRVPEICFDADVKVMVNEIHHVQGRSQKYIRECQIEYGKNTYVFELSTHIEEGIVHRFTLDVYTPAGDGKGGLLKLFSENVV